MLGSTPTVLNYDLNKRQRRRFVILFAVVLPSLTLCMCGYRRYHPIIKERVDLAWQQHVFANHSAPPDLVVYEEDPTEAAKLLAAGGHYEDVSSSFPEPGVAFPVGYWYGLEIAALDQDCGFLLFLHERRTARNEARLALVTYGMGELTKARRVLDFRCTTCAYAPLLSGRPEMTAICIYTVELTSADRLRLFCGQPSSDPSKFTVNYDLNGQSGVIEGIVDMDGVPRLSVKTGSLNIRYVIEEKDRKDFSR